jgi:hypothetical protein
LVLTDRELDQKPSLAPAGTSGNTTASSAGGDERVSFTIDSSSILL